MPRVLITPPQFQDPQRTYYKKLIAAGFEVRFASKPLTGADAPTLLRELEGIDGVLASTEPYTREVLGKAKLRAIARAGVGYDSVDVPAASDHGVVVTITPGAVDVSVAEHTLALILGIFRDVVGRDREVRSGKWTRAARPRLAGRTLGIYGLGRIGKTLVPRAQGLGLQVVAHDPFADPAWAASQKVALLSSDDLFRTADIISLHCPCTAETANLIGERTLKLMKPDAVLVNMGRGGLVDEVALATAMKAGHLFGAALDVFQVEPLPTTSPLLGIPNLLLATHTGGLDFQSEEDMSCFAAQNLIDLQAGRWPEASIINRQLKGNWRW